MVPIVLTVLRATWIHAENVGKTQLWPTLKLEKRTPYYLRVLFSNSIAEAQEEV